MWISLGFAQASYKVEGIGYDFIPKARSAAAFRAQSSDRTQQRCRRIVGAAFLLAVSRSVWTALAVLLSTSERTAVVERRRWSV
jgi:hypothetical protein